MLFDDELALRNIVGLFRSNGLGSAPTTIHRQKSSSSDLRSSQSRSQSVDLDLHALYNSPRSFREAMEMIGSGTDEDWAGDANSPNREAVGQKMGERPVGPDDGGRRSISVAVTNSVDLVIERVSKEAIEKSAASKRTSALTDALNPKKTPPAASKAAPGRLMSAGADEVMHKITIYLPDRSPLQLRVPASMTFNEVIRLVLYTVRSNPTLSAKVKLTENPGNYELRLHEGGGEADEDFPALDRNGKVKHFGDTTTHEYCLREIAGFRGAGGCRSTSPLPSPEGPSSPRRVTCATSPVIPYITVVLPNQSQMKVIVEGSKTTVHDVLTRVLKENHRLQFSTEVFCLHYSDGDRQRKRLPPDALDPWLTVLELGVDTLMLKRKVFADDPASLSQHAQDGRDVSFQPGQQGAKQEGEEAGSTTQERRPDPESFVFTAETAFVYKEWTVTKKNKFGRKQVRVLGMDDSKIYNYKRDSKGNRRVDGVYRAERPISTVRSVEFVDEDIKMLRIQFEEDGALNVAEYTAESAYECAEIVYRLRYIVRKGTGGAANRA